MATLLEGYEWDPFLIWEGWTIYATRISLLLWIMFFVGIAGCIATFVILAIESKRVVGIARALFDGASNGYISTAAVAAHRRRQGVGRELVKQLMDVDQPANITWVLRAGRGSTGFWEKMGFRKSDTAMEIVRRE